jgi:hypothetical protein
MGANTLLERLRGLETELHRLQTCQNRGRMESLLHPETELAAFALEYPPPDDL